MSFDKDNYPISPERFWEAFKKIIGECNKDALRKAYTNSDSWTTYLTNKLIEKIPETFNLESVMKEFWPRVDIAFFDKCTDTDWEKWAWEIAVELENNPQTWWEECNKLMTINCGLKVLVTYYDSGLDVIEKKLKEFLEIYKSRKYYSENDHWLLIFGPMDPYRNGPEWQEFHSYRVDVINGNPVKERLESTVLFS